MGQGEIPPQSTEVNEAEVRGLDVSDRHPRRCGEPLKEEEATGETADHFRIPGRPIEILRFSRDSKN